MTETEIIVVWESRVLIRLIGGNDCSYAVQVPLSCSSIIELGIIALKKLGFSQGQLICNKYEYSNEISERKLLLLENENNILRLYKLFTLSCSYINLSINSHKKIYFPKVAVQ